MSKRCESRDPATNTQCGLPKGHLGRHQNGVQIKPWDDDILHQVEKLAESKRMP